MMRKSKPPVSREKKNDIFLLIKFLLPFCLVIAVPLVAGYSLNQYAVVKNKQKTLDSYAMLLEENMELTDITLKNLEETANAVASNPDVNEFFYTGDMSSSQLLRIRDVIGSYTRGKAALTIYLYNPNTGVMIDDKAVYRDTGQFYEVNLEPEGVSRRGWEQLVSDKRWRREYTRLQNTQEEPAGMLHLAQSVPVTYTDTIQGYIGLMLSETELLQEYERVLADGEGNIIVLNGNQKIMASVNRNFEAGIDALLAQLPTDGSVVEQKINGQKVLVGRMIHDRNGWSYVSVQPSKEVFADISMFTVLMVLLYLLMAVITFFIILYMAKRRTKVFKDILSMLGESGAKMPAVSFKHGEFDYLKEGLSEMIIQNESFKEKFHETHEMAGYVVIDNIIKGVYRSEKEIEKELEKMDFKFPEGEFIVMVIHVIDHTGNQEKAQEIFQHVIDKLYEVVDKYMFVHSMPNGVITMLVQPEAETRDALMAYVQALVSKIRGSIEYRGEVELVFGCAGPAGRKVEISKYYKLADNTAVYNTMGYEREIIWYEDLLKMQDSYYFPSNLERRLFDYAAAGNKLEISNTLDLIYNQNFLYKKISVEAAKRLMDELVTCVNRILKYVKENSQEIGDYTLVRRDGAHITEFFAEANDILQQVCDGVNEANYNKNQNIILEIIQYIDDNFMKESISLTELSVRFRLSEKYISAIFKEHTGENFSSYVENKRIDEACRLMSVGGYSIQEIAGRVGYSNDSTFRRAFKRNKGVPPSEYLNYLKDNA